MKDRDPLTVRDDTEGHTFKIADAERAETDDAEGHSAHFFGADAERGETDDAQGHAVHWGADAERDETDDAEGHCIKY